MRRNAPFQPSRVALLEVTTLWFAMTAVFRRRRGLRRRRKQLTDTQFALLLAGSLLVFALSATLVSILLAEWDPTESTE